MERRITTSLPALPRDFSERPTQRFDRLVQEEVSREITQDLSAKMREEQARTEITESLVEAHEVQDRFMRLIEDDLSDFEDREATPNRRATSQLFEPRERMLRAYAQRPTFNDFLSNTPKNMPRHEMKRAYAKFAAAERAFEDEMRSMRNKDFRPREHTETTSTPAAQAPQDPNIKH